MPFHRRHVAGGVVGALEQDRLIPAPYNKCFSNLAFTFADIDGRPPGQKNGKNHGVDVGKILAASMPPKTDFFQKGGRGGRRPLKT